MLKCQYIQTYVSFYQKEFLMAYYRRIRDLREDNDYTQSYVAKILGITQQQYSLYESGRRDIPTTALLALADLYNTTTDYILGREI